MHIMYICLAVTKISGFICLAGLLLLKPFYYLSQTLVRYFNKGSFVVRLQNHSFSVSLLQLISVAGTTVTEERLCGELKLKVATSDWK